MNFETPSLGNEGMWAGIFEAGCTQIWEVLEADEGGGHMAPMGMQQKHCCGPWPTPKGLPITGDGGSGLGVTLLPLEQ